MKKDILAVIILLILSFWAIRPLTSAGFFPVHDDTQIGRVVEMGKVLREGQFPVRWVPDLGYGYGYPLYNFYGPLPYYVGGFFYAVGFDGLTATKIMFALGIILSGVTMYFFASRVFGRIGGLVAGLFYIYAPYHSVDIYLRGAVGEFWALIFLPLILWGLWKGKLSGPGAILLGSLGIAGVVLSHTILGYVTVFFYLTGLLGLGVLKLVFRKINRQIIIRALMILVLGLGISAFFWLPALVEMHFTNVSGQISQTANFRDHFVCLNQLWDSAWGYGGSAPGCFDGFSFKLGKIHLLMALGALLTWFWRRKKVEGASSLLMLLSSVIVAAAVLMSLPISVKIWEIVPDFAYIQYPWRFITYAVFGLSVLAGSLFIFIKSKVFRMITGVAAVALLLWFNIKLFTPQYLYDKPVAAFETDTELKWRVSKISDEYLPPDFVKPTNFNDIPSEAITSTPDFKVTTSIDTATYARYIILAGRDHNLTVKRTYFPGWKYILNGKEVLPKVVGGLPEFFIPQGNYTFEISFTNTLVRTLGNIISLLTIVFIIVYYGKKTYS